MKKLHALILTAVLLFGCIFTATSCASLDTDDLLAKAPDLIARSAKFNDIYYGAGIPYGTLGGAAIGNYYPADTAFLDENGFHTVDELKAKTAEVFSANYCESIFAYAFSGFTSEVGGTVYARYSSNQIAGDRDENETILVYSEHEPILSGTTVYDYSTITLEEVGRGHAILSLRVTVRYPATEDTPETETAPSTLKIRFVYENGWRIDSATY